MPFDASPSITDEAIDAINVLTRTRAFLDERDWCRGRYFVWGVRDIEYRPESLASVCLEGALHGALGNTAPRSISCINELLPYQALMKTIPGIHQFVADWNDRHARDKDQVLAVIDDAISLLRSGWLP